MAKIVETSERAKARKVISKILNHVDYDLWKGYFHKPSFEQEPEDIETEIQSLINIVLKEMK